MPGGLTLQVRSKSVLCYWKRGTKSTFRTKERQQSIDNLLSFANNEQERYTGMVTPGSQKRLSKALENLLQIAKYKLATTPDGKQFFFKVNFVTLTLYNFGKQVPAKEAHRRCLEPLLRWLRTRGMSAYVWKAELQTKRKDCTQLHYHLTTDVFIDYNELRLYWNNLQRKAGYLDYFFEKFGHWNPNSTDVHAVHKIKNLIGYLKKRMVRYSDKKKYQALRGKYLVRAEMAKANQNQKSVEGKIWDCSYNIKTAFFEIAAYEDITSKLAESVKNKEITIIEKEHCTVYEINKGNDARSYIPYPHRVFYDDHIEKMRSYKRLKPDINTFSSS